MADWKTFNPMHHIVIQNASDEYFLNTISEKTVETQRKEQRLFEINRNLSMIEEALRIAREKGSSSLDLRKLEGGREKLNELWEELREDYPELMGNLSSPIPPSLNLSKVDKDTALTIIDELRNAQQCDERAVSAIVRALDLAAKMYHLATEVMTQKGKQGDERKTMVRNQLPHG